MNEWCPKEEIGDRFIHPLLSSEKQLPLPCDLQGFRVKEGLSCVFSHATTVRKSTQLSPALTRNPVLLYLLNCATLVIFDKE